MQNLSNAWRSMPWVQGLRADTLRERGRWVLKSILLFLAVGSLVFYAVPQPGFGHNSHLLAAVAYGLLILALQAGVATRVAAHLTFVVAMFHIVAVSLLSGGIHSITLVWLTMVPLAAIMVLDRRAALFWGGVALVLHLALMVLSQSGVVDSYTQIDPAAMAWTVLNRVLVIGLAMGLVYLADHLRRVQADAIERNNQMLEQTHTALRQAHAHKDEFIASVGHKLRTHMNAVLGLNGILRAELAARPGDVETVDHIRRATEQLLRVVSDILDFSQLQAGQLALQAYPFPLHQTVQGVMHAYQARAAAKSLALRLEAGSVQGLWVNGDSRRLVQILQNLLDNAVKFTPRGHIQVRVSSAGLGVRFEIEDTGIGIPLERQQQVFDRFECADLQTNRQYGGTGLGLSICERLVVLQGGRIGVNSLAGQGTTFWFELPLSPTTAPALQACEDPRAVLFNRSLHILLVDDSDVNRMIERLLLKKIFSHAEVTEAASGMQALKALQSQPFDLVLMDLVMPDIDGLQTTQVLRQHFPPPLCNVPVIGLSVSTRAGDHDRCLAAGMNGVLSRPLDEAQLVVHMAQALKRVPRAPEVLPPPQDPLALQVSA